MSTHTCANCGSTFNGPVKHYGDYWKPCCCEKCAKEHKEKNK